MKRLFSLLAVAALLLTPVVWAEDMAKGPGGYIVTSEGKRIEVIAFTNLMPQFVVTYQGQLMRVPMKDIKTLDLKDSGLELTNSAGKTFIVRADFIISMGEMISYTAVNPITNQPNPGEIDPVLVQAVGFDWPGPKKK